MNLFYVRAMFDDFTLKFEDFYQYLSPYAPIVASQHFENAIVKLQSLNYQAPLALEEENVALVEAWMQQESATH